jgi:helicase
MKLDALTAYGILPAFIDCWRKTIGEQLLDWQADAINHYGLLDTPAGQTPRRNLLVVAPTSSGKTFIGELAAAAALSARKKVVFIVPLKAIAGEKFAHFEHTFGALGFTPIISTRDHRQFDSAFSSGKFDVAVVVAEKFRHVLINNIDVLERVELIVADELHLLSDPDRGPALLSVLEKLTRSAFTCRLIGLSTRLPAADFLARFLDARILRVCRRPVELRRGVLCDGVFRFREDNSGETGAEQLGEPGNRDDDSTLELINRQLAAGEQILVFGKAKADCFAHAAALARTLQIEHELNETDRWVLAAGGPVYEGLAEWYAKGIGVHHADLSLAQRRLTERLFHTGKLRIIFCTGTLAMGVNLPASIVYVEAERFAGGRYGGAPFLTALAPHEFDNAAGRAGRLGLAVTHGRAILCAATPIEAEILWETYIAATPHEDCATLCWPPVERRILEAVACGLVADYPASVEYFREVAPGVPDTGPDLDRHLEQLIAKDLLVTDDDHGLHVTPAGLIAAASGVSPASIRQLGDWIKHSHNADPIGWTAAVLALPESIDVRWGRRYQGPFDPVAEAWRGQFSENFEPTMARFFPEAFRPEVCYPQPQLRRRAMAAALALGDWAKGESADILAATHQAPQGRFEQAAETISWLIDTAAALAEADSRHRDKAQPLHRTAFEIRHGLPWSLRDLAEAVGGDLPREVVLQLARLGWTTPASLTGVGPEDFHSILPEKIAGEIITRAQRWIARREKTIEHIRRLGSEVPAAAGMEKPDLPHKKQNEKESTMPQAIMLDGRRIRSRFAVELGGNPCTLRAKSFKYLFALAAARYMRDDGWVDKRDVEGGENQIKYFYQLRQELKAAQDGAHHLIENDGAGRYRLALPPEVIRFNLEKIADFPDWEIRQTAERLSNLHPERAA